MHAATVLQKSFADVFAGMHALRVRTLLGAVRSLVSCRRLVLMDLARAWPGAEQVRAPLKRLDRLLSNAHLQAERGALYGQMARWTVRGVRPVIVVDWSTLKADERWHLLRAAVAVGGRTVTVYEEVHSQQAHQTPRVHRRFLQQLQRVLPSGCCPIVVTDAGFRSPWFRAVEALGWHWVGRVRNQVCVRRQAGPWQLLRQLYGHGPALRVFGGIQMARRQPLSCQLLRYRQARQGRKHRTRRRRVSRNRLSREAARSQREPWLLAYSNSLSGLDARQIVQVYGQRMQIEQSFRDLKCGRYGCAFQYSLTRKPARIAVLLLLQALAGWIAWLQGVWVQQQRQTLHCAIRADRCQYSLLRIGWEALRRGAPAGGLLQLTDPRHPPAWFTVALSATT